LEFIAIGIILLGSTFGLILRIFIQDNFKKSIGFDIQNTSIVNFLSSFLLGILIILNLDYLGKFFWQVVYQIDRYLRLVPIFRSEFGKDISILTIILRNALL